MDAAGSEGLTWLQVAALLVALAGVIIGGAYLWARHRQQSRPIDKP